MEAMALERPVLATYVAGIPELVKHGEDGWLFPAGSVDELASAMRECVEAPVSEIARMGAHARERALMRHSIDKEVKPLADLFRDAVLSSGKIAKFVHDSHHPNTAQLAESTDRHERTDAQKGPVMKWIGGPVALRRRLDHSEATPATVGSPFTVL
jgi:hypothetical protein